MGDFALSEAALFQIYLVLTVGGLTTLIVVAVGSRHVWKILIATFAIVVISLALIVLSDGPLYWPGPFQCSIDSRGDRICG
jgi:hypothetical protein